jgi:hypothetical protein
MTESVSPYAPLIKHLAEHKEVLPLPEYIDVVEFNESDWGIFVALDNPTKDYKVSYIGFHHEGYRLVATFDELNEYPHDGKTFCQELLPELLDATV